MCVWGGGGSCQTPHSPTPPTSAGPWAAKLTFWRGPPTRLQTSALDRCGGAHPAATTRWAVGYGLWAVGCGLWAVGCGLWAVGCGLWAVCTVLVAWLPSTPCVFVVHATATRPSPFLPVHTALQQLLPGGKFAHLPDAGQPAPWPHHVAHVGGAGFGVAGDFASLLFSVPSPPSSAAPLPPYCRFPAPTSIRPPARCRPLFVSP